jgi:hypothetical protein
MNEIKFQLGELVSTPGAQEHLTQEEVIVLVARHLTGDWGDLEDEDKAENELSVKTGFRILSAYNVRGTRIWVITAAGRSATILLLPSEY